MENEIMNYEEEIMDNEIVCCEGEVESSGMSTGLAMVIGAGAAAAGYAVVKGIKWLHGKWKAHKELKKPKEGEDVEVTEEQINEIQPEKSSGKKK